MILNPSNQIRFEFNTKGLIQAGIVLAAGLTAGFLLRTPMLFAGVLILAASVYLALNHPILTVILTVFLSLYANSLKNVFPFLEPFIELPLFNIRLWDPMIFGMIFVLAWKILSGDPRVKTALLKSIPLFSILFLILFLQVLRSIGNFGFYTLGEFRTYYGPLLLVPYLCAFMTAPEKRLRMLKVLLWMAFLLIPVSIINALFSPDVEFGIRWVRAFGAIALLNGLIAFYIFTKRNIVNIRIYWYIPIFALSGFILVITSHRSVWLASVAAFAALFFTRHIRKKNLVTFFLLILLVGSAAFFAFDKAGHQPQTFISSRLKAFTNPVNDPTSNWRLLLWEEAIQDIRQNPFFGLGLGTHFNIVIGTNREIVITSPHNLYITIPFQIGIPGFLAYLGFVGMLFFRFKSNRYKTFLIPLDRALLTMGFVILVSMHVFYITFTSEIGFLNWAYLGLAVSVLVNRDLNKEERAT